MAGRVRRRGDGGARQLSDWSLDDGSFRDGISREIQELEGKLNPRVDRSPNSLEYDWKELALGPVDVGLEVFP